MLRELFLFSLPPHLNPLALFPLLLTVIHIYHKKQKKKQKQKKENLHIIMQNKFALKDHYKTKGGSTFLSKKTLWSFFFSSHGFNEPFETKISILISWFQG